MNTIQSAKPAPRKKSLTPEEKEKRAFLARLRFKALVRFVIANREWLLDEEDDDEGDNVQKNITKSMRKKDKQSLLSFRDKVILNKPLHLRTDEEKQLLLKSIGNLRCFRRYPVDVKTQLPTVMFFSYFGANRVICRQDAEPHNMYVIVSGQIGVTRTDWDKALKQDVTKELGVMEAGTIVGEVSLLHGILRTATLTTITPCELLYLQREDFNRVLKSTVAAAWQEVTEDMSRFDYFDLWGEIDRREACILSRKGDYKLDQIVFGNDIGSGNYVYFVTKGSCYVIEYVLLRVYETKGIKRFELADEKESEVRPEKIEAVSVKEIMKRVQIEQEQHDESTSSDSGVNDATEKTSQKLSRGDPRISDISTTTPQTNPQAKRKSDKSSRTSITAPKSSNRALDYKLRWHFIKICTFKELACFNVGENLKNRLFVAGSNDTECLMLPRYFLFDKDAPTFEKVQYYLSRNIPNTKMIFKDFLQEKRWQRYKQKLVKDILSQNKRFNSNTIYNVPYSIRLADDVGFRI